MNKIFKKLLWIYLDYYIFIDLLILITLFLIFYFTWNITYINLHEIYIFLIWFPVLALFSNSEKINRLKKSNLYRKIFYIYIIYSFIYCLLIFVMKDIKELDLCTKFYFSLLLVVFLRLFIFSLLIIVLHLYSKNK